MAKKSTCKKNVSKKSKKRASKKISWKIQLLKVFAGLGVLLFLVVAAGFSVHYLLLRKQNTTPPLVTEKIKPLKPAVQKEHPPNPKIDVAPKKTTPPPSNKVDQEPKKKTPFPSSNFDHEPGKKNLSPETEIKTAKIPSFKKPTFYEVFPEKDLSPPKDVAKPLKKTLSKDRPKVAIIIDDLGYDPYIAKKLVELEPNLTFSVIPHTPFQNKVAEMVRKNGGELMLHIPMEPNEYPAIDPGPGALLTSMEPDQLIAQLQVNLATLSDAKGINGHMGSKLTASSEQMYQIFTVLKQKNLYFVDSLTTSDSVCKPSATLLKVAFAQRDVFIDHFQEPEFMRKQIHRLLDTAKKHGEAIGIAHPHKETLQVLEQMMPMIKQQADVVPASKLVK